MGEVRSFGDYDRCERGPSNYEVFHQTFPQFEQIRGSRLALYSSGSIPTTRRNNMREIALSRCNQKVTQAFWGEIQALKATLQRFAQLRTALENYRNPRDPALEVYVRNLVTVRSDGTGIRVGVMGPFIFHSSPSSRASRPELLEREFQENQRACASFFKGNVKEGWRR
jgi:hypothetical protein